VSTGVTRGAEAVVAKMQEDSPPDRKARTRAATDTDGLAREVDRLRSRFGEDVRRWPAEAREQLRDLLTRTPGLAAAEAREARLLARHTPLASALEQAAPVARVVGLELWAPGAGPLAEREVLRAGGWQKVRPNELNYL